jgi:general secretion pathway protein B
VSFILDALRKSESERQMDAVPQVMRVPLSVGRSRVPGWAVAVIVVLSAALVASVGGFWWLGRQAAGEAMVVPRRDAGVDAIEAEPPADAPATAPAESRDAGLPAPVDTVVEAPDSVSRPSDAPAAREPAVAEVRAATASVEPEPASRAAADAPATETPEILPTLTELIADGASLPLLQLELHVMGSSNANRFVYINGSRYAEGETLDEGPEVVAINAQGVVLDYAGRRFLLTQN